MFSRARCSSELINPQSLEAWQQRQRTKKERLQKQFELQPVNGYLFSHVRSMLSLDPFAASHFPIISAL